MATVDETYDPTKTPHETGTLVLNLNIKPVSSQASRSKKDIVTEAIKTVTRPLQYLLSCDVSIEIVWQINEYERYESDEAADVDNILKPILDALSGPEGVLINDCQVQHVSSHWISRFDEEERIEITIRFDPEAFFEKDKIMFVQLHKSLCMPIHDKVPPEQTKILLDVFEMQLNARERIFARGGTYYQARYVMSIQRFFHKTRLDGFNIVKADDLRASIEGSVQPPATVKEPATH